MAPTGVELPELEFESVGTADIEDPVVDVDVNGVEDSASCFVCEAMACSRSSPIHDIETDSTDIISLTVASVSEPAVRSVAIVEVESSEQR